MSLDSGLACACALARSFPTRRVDLTADALPEGLNPRRDLVFSTLHGTFGEDGGMQALLDAAGVHYAGCDAASSALTMDKTRTKETVAARGLRVPKAMLFAGYAQPAIETVVAQLGTDLVIKPNAEGSSVGLSVAANRTELAAAFAKITAGSWMVEQRISGRELSVGVLDGQALGVVEIRPHSGIYDYASKYTKGATEYFAPAPLGPALTAATRQAAETAFAACGCRDYARVDFMLAASGELYLLEINTLPGMKEMSLLPKSARCVGLDFTTLVKAMVTPALRRFQAATASDPS